MKTEMKNECDWIFQKMYPNEILKIKGVKRKLSCRFRCTSSSSSTKNGRFQDPIRDVAGTVAAVVADHHHTV
jgi:hypothetical protein